MTQRDLAVDLCDSAPGEMEEFDPPYAYEALARAHALAGDAAQARECLGRARVSAGQIEDEDDRRLLEGDLGTISP